MRTILLVIVLFCAATGYAQEPGNPNYRWAGHDFAFCFITDDGRLSNLAWADTARVMDFRFTLAVNMNSALTGSITALSPAQLEVLAADGFEIGQHSYSHSQIGLPTECPLPPRGSLMGYFLCDGVDPAAAMVSLHAEIERDSIAVLDGVETADVRTLAYPRHRHGKALIDSLIAEGYIAARTGGRTSYASNSYGDFDVAARNGWEEGISLYRVPLATSDAALFGDHSADPPVHYTDAQFEAATQPHIDRVKAKGGIFALYTHHLGDDDDSYGDINSGAGGISKRDIARMVDLVRANNGLVLTFGEAAAYIRARSVMQDLDGDYVWVPYVAAATDLPAPSTIALSAHPNPFNSRAIIEGSLAAAGMVRLDIYDAAGALVTTLAHEHREAGLHSWPWDGRDRAGRMQSAGIYFAVLRSGEEWATSRLLFIK